MYYFKQFSITQRRSNLIFIRKRKKNSSVGQQPSLDSFSVLSEPTKRTYTSHTYEKVRRPLRRNALISFCHSTCCSRLVCLYTHTRARAPFPCGELGGWRLIFFFFLRKGGKALVDFGVKKVCRGRKGLFGDNKVKFFIKYCLGRYGFCSENKVKCYVHVYIIY